ncbi:MULTISPECIES: c-type cytochrome [Paracoccus]|uniref:c-type cytochrome n=1 Tax=Paracoccus TaxID=265 RepID=UPI0011125157|nr:MULTISPECIES: cytochrome c [Paracoccus]TNC04187.1 cytochrome c [Paracoccus marcusii]
MSKSRLFVLIAVIGAAVFVWALRRPDTAAATGTPMVTVNVPSSLSLPAAKGRTAFDTNCASCHGENASGRDGIGPPLIDPIYRPGHHADIAFELAARTGARQHHWTFGNMPPTEGVTDADLAVIIAYIREIQRANGIN